MKFKTFSITLAFILFVRFFSFAGEGMWIPLLLQQLNEKEMQEMGMKITADDIYSINHSSLKDAILLFGRGCTSEIISKDGLLLTNHHCGFGQIQKHSSIEHDYLTDGFWAMSKKEELVNPGLTATLMVEMREVTNEVFNGVQQNMTEKERNTLIKENAESVIKNAIRGTHYKAIIKPFFKGNQYYMIITETFKDIRLVGAPPSNIGKFGGDTDNWMWPRHTGDFSLFRIYVGPDGKPAEYAEDNIPYQPKYHFPISLKGVEKDDFTFVFGYPARTNEYLPSYAIELITEIENPQKIALRQARLDIFKKYADSDPKVRIQYASKDARVANYWKKMIGESGGIKRMNGIDKKQAYEAEFNQWAGTKNKKYVDLLPNFKYTYNKLTPLNVATAYFVEAGLAMEIVSFANRFRKLVNLSQKKPVDEEKVQKEIEKLKSRTATFFKDYYKPIDKEVMVALLRLYNENLTQDYKPDFFISLNDKYKTDYVEFTDEVFKDSFFDNEEAINALLDKYNAKSYKKIEKDPAYMMANDLMNMFETRIKKPRANYNHSIDSLMRIYMKAQMEMQPDRRFYPDANFTLRVTYGHVKGYSPKDAVDYNYFTTLKGIMEKEDPEIYDYVVEDKLKTLYQNKDYGKYGDKDGTLHVGFITTNHTTGGNSGSPVLNAEGQLVGVNFDRAWEGTMSDLMYDPNVCRNISIDIRYFLFIVDKFAGAGYLVDEMDLVE
ncbi:MAG: S46 family peptidase [Bacteroidales bacterium]|nr:S46 family peptidase [Bacteroidales bacterium]